MINMDNNSPKILIAEDDTALSNALSLKLTHEGFNIQKAYDGEEALNLIKKESFDLILLDLIMPKVDGFGVLEALRKDNIKTKVIVISGLSQPEDFQKVRNLGVDDFYIKSDVSLSKIVDSIKANLQK